MKKNPYLSVFKAFALISVLLLVSCEKDTEPAEPFKVLSSTPANGTTNVSVKPKIVITFNKKPSAATIRGDDFFLIGNDGNEVDCDITYDGASTVTYTPKTELNSSELYNVSLEKSVASDQTKMTENYKFSFTIERVPFKILSVTPTDKSTGVKVDSYVIITFSKKIVPSKSVSARLYIPGIMSSWMVDYNFANTAMRLYTPTLKMTKGSIYNVDFKSVTSADGDVITDFASSFETEK